MSKILSRTEILAFNDITLKELEIPEWGGSVFIATLTAGQRDEFELLVETMVKEIGIDKTKVKARATLASVACVDADGKRLFTNKDIDALAKKSASALNRIIAESELVNKLTASAVEDIAKN